MLYLPYALLLGLVFFNFYPVLLGRLIFVERDLSTYFIPPRLVWTGMAKSFTFPLWNPHNYSGIPLLATLQPGVLYPPQVLYLFLPFNLVFNWLIILHYLFAGFTTCLLLRRLMASRTASFAGGACFMFSGYLLSIHSMIPHLFGVSWFPLVVLFFLKYLEASRGRHLVATAACLCMVFLSGAPEILLTTLLVLVLLAFFGSTMVQGDFSRWRGIKALIKVGLLFVLLSGVQLLPFLELESMSIRQGGLSYWEATLWSFGFRDFIQFFIDDAFGAFHNLDRYWQNQAWLKSVYLGLCPFVLSVFFFLSKDRRRVAFLVVMGLSLFLALGGNTPLYRLLYHVPPFDGLRYPVKFLFLFIFVLSVAAGLGLDRLKEGMDTGDRRTFVAARAFFFVGFLLALAWASMNLFHDQVYHFLDVRGFKPDVYNELAANLHNAKRFLFFSFLFCTFLLLYYRSRRTPLAYVLVSLLVIDLFFANAGYFRTTSWQAYTAPPQFAKLLAPGSSPDRYFVDPSATDELYAFPQNRAAMAPTYAGIFGLYTVGGSEVMKVAHQEAFHDMVKKASEKERRTLFTAAGIKYVVSLKPINDPRFRRVKSVSAESAKREERVRVYLYEYRDYPGRVYLAGRGRFVDSDEDAGKALKSKKADPRNEVILTGGAPRVEDAGRVKGEARFVRYGANRVEIEYTADLDALLYLSDTYYPGWRAYVDGQRKEILRANMAFRAVRVPKGSHTVVFTYVPLSFYAGLVMTVMGIGACVVVLMRGGTRSKRG